MKVLIIGGTGLTGPHVVRQLVEQGNTVAVFNRGKRNDLVPDGVQRFQGDRQGLKSFRDQFAAFAPQVVLDMIPFRQERAHELMQIFVGMAGRVVGLSSIDVYAAYGRLHKTEPGPLEPIPLAEDAALRQTKQPHGEDYDKLGIEQEMLGCPNLPGTILRLPAIYGPRDGQHRLYQYLKRMDDNRPAILIGALDDQWRFSRGYSENVAAAVTLAVTQDQSAGRIYK